MKTAIEQLIEELQNGFLEDKFNNASDILLLCEKYQSKEKQQIIKAYSDGWKNPSKYREHGSVHYYENTFNTTNKETLK